MNQVIVTIDNTKHNSRLSDPKEGWTIEVSQQSEEKEVSTITITFGDKNWQGSIQDFFAIQVIAKNALFEMKVLTVSGNDVTAIQSKEELESLLSHFK